MSQRILVINPNSTQAVTDNTSRALEPLRMEGGPAIECMTLAEGPPGVESQADVESVVLPVSCVVRGTARATSTPSSSPATAIPACMRSAKRLRGPSSESPNAAC